ncbi:hypothetical protein [Chlorogloeopsis sp. ULAP01]|uniref:hypothetical protein n=1 Tax=Chlorogloeopsis sp. ULAP01 TaxID=3056483 RepID=UPI0025AC7999|nr:hypothetical protein [Chlorogloeopsis sp. ULAP01]
MKSLINYLNNMRWNRMFTIVLSISILLFTQACAPRRISTQSAGGSPVSYPFNQAGN